MVKITFIDADTYKIIEILEGPYNRFTNQHYKMLKRSLLFNLAYHAKNISFVVDVNNNKVLGGGAFYPDSENCFWWLSTPQHLSKSYFNNFYSKSCRKENLKK